jgi:hypothetical protein
MCVNEAEKYATRLLDQISLKAKYFDRGIKFELRRQFLWSFVSITFPEPDDGTSQESPLIGSDDSKMVATNDIVNGIETMEPQDVSNSIHLKSV